MADSSMGLHEAKEDLAPPTVDRHRGIVSLMEELEAMDWYQQRIDADRRRRARPPSSPTTATRRPSTRP